MSKQTTIVMYGVNRVNGSRRSFSNRFLFQIFADWVGETKLILRAG